MRISNSKSLRRTLLYTLPLVFGIASAAHAEESDLALKFHQSLDDAFAAEGEPRPMVISFGAPWCGWCRKMETDTFTDERVDALADQFVWVKIDIDEQQEVAARFGVTSVPQTVILDTKGRMLGSRGGYLAADKLIALLNESLENPHPEELLADLPTRLAKPVTDDQRRDIVLRAVEALAKPDRTQREELLIALKAQGSTVWPVLFDLTADDRLAARPPPEHSSTPPSPSCHFILSPHRWSANCSGPIGNHGSIITAKPRRRTEKSQLS